MDCPPSLGLLTINALTLAHEVIVPMQAHFLALQGLSKLLETVGRVREGINPTLSVAGIVLCMHEANTILAGEVINDLKGFLDQARGTDAPWRDAVVYEPPIRRNIKLAEAPSFGKSIFHYAARLQRRSRLSQAGPVHPRPSPGSRAITACKSRHGGSECPSLLRRVRKQPGRYAGPGRSSRSSRAFATCSPPPPSARSPAHREPGPT